MEIDNLIAASLPFSLEGLPARTLGYEHMLWHLCRHHLANVFRPFRLIWAADIVSFAERFAAETNWKQVKEQYPLILHTLSLLHFTTPLSQELLALSSVDIGRAPQGIGVEFQGWPRSSLAAQREKGYWGIFCDSFFPSEWWLRLRYGLGSTRTLFWCRWVQHPLHILGWIKQLLLERLGWRA
jgi:hypothetical protein